MNQIPFGSLGWPVNPVGLGTWNIGNQWGVMDDATATSIVHGALLGGANLIDTAESYGIPNGLSELRLGRSLVGRPRESYVLVSKIGNWGLRTGQKVPKTTPDMIRLCGHGIAGRLGVRMVDVLLCHEGTIEDPSIYIAGFNELKAEGFVREYGISTDSLPVLKNFWEKSGGQCRVVELDYSLMNRTAEAELLPWCQEKGIAVLVRGPLAQGILSGRFDLSTKFEDSVRSPWNVGGAKRGWYEDQMKTLARIKSAVGDAMPLSEAALRFIISHPCRPVLIPGATSVRQVASNMACGKPLDPDLYQRLVSAG